MKEFLKKFLGLAFCLGVFFICYTLLNVLTVATLNVGIPMLGINLAWLGFGGVMFLIMILPLLLSVIITMKICNWDIPTLKKKK